MADISMKWPKKTGRKCPKINDICKKKLAENGQKWLNMAKLENVQNEWYMKKCLTNSSGRN